MRKQGASDAESIIVEKDYTATTHEVSGLDPATLYEIIIYTKTDISTSQPVSILQPTAPDAIPFPEVVKFIEDTKLITL